MRNTEREVQRVGSNRDDICGCSVNCLPTATSAEEVSAGRFRRDLLLPPFAECGGD